MFCTQCGRKLPEDGTPCVCGSGQVEVNVIESAEPVAPEAEPVSFAEAERLAEEEGAVPELFVAEEPVAAEPIPEEVQPEPEYIQPEPEYVQPEPEYVQPPVYGQPAPTYYAPPAYAVQQSPVKDAIRMAAASPVFLLAAIFLSVNLVLSAIQLFMPIDYYGLFSAIVPVFDAIMPGMGSEFMREMEASIGDLYAAQAGIAVAGLPSLLIPGLTVLSFWMIFVSAKRPDGPKTGGLTILQVLQVISVVAASFSILLAIFLIVMIFALAAMLIEELGYYGVMPEGDFTAAIISIAIVLVIVVIIAVTIGMIFTIKALNSVVRAKKAINTGVIHKGASRFIMVYCFISAAVSLADVYGTVQLLGVLNGISVICSAAANVFIALTILRYNKVIKPFRTSKYAAPVVPPNYPPYGTN